MQSTTYTAIKNCISFAVQCKTYLFIEALCEIKVFNPDLIRRLSRFLDFTDNTKYMNCKAKCGILYLKEF